ncbi:MAG: asparagine synthase (glutamine-hydrolyzing) [Rhodospirillales bacterium]|nr:asparagine synthase (glutamine-hydrolyzing) [Rhodospirillales bacterium]
MCGIGGIFLPRNAPPQDADLTAMMAAMRHRGPDGSGRFVSADRRYQAAFRRLAIIDLKTGDQPIVEGNGARVLVGNGEIYNYIELRKETADYPYRTAGDMETVLPLAARHGLDFVHRLNGMYALALYESAADRLLLVRDRLGVKPLYWTRLAAGGIAFASEIKALFASGLVDRAIDEESVSAYLSHGYVPAPRTLFRGVFKLPPGHILVAGGDGSISVTSYWRPAMAENVPEREEAIEEHLLALLEDSVRIQLRSDVPVGALLSGGIDSGLLVALAAKHTSEPLRTYTVSFEGTDTDEAPLAQTVAARYGTRHTRITVPTRSAASVLPRLAWYAEEPLNDAALLPNFLIEEVVGRHVKVVLNGTGGDELFAGYGRYFQLPVERAYLRMPRWFRRGIVAPACRAFSPYTAWRLARADLFARDRGRYLHEHSCHFPPPLRSLIGNRLPLPEGAQAAAFHSFQGPPATAALAADMQTYLPDDLLTLLDRTSMAWSVEARVPFLDHRLVEAALAVPPEIRTRDGRQKSLERAIARRFLPGDVIAAPKQGFVSPVPQWMTAGLGGLARRLLTSRSALARGWWTKAGVERLLARPDAHGYRLYTLLMLELAVRLFVESRPTVAPPGATLEDIADAA